MKLFKDLLATWLAGMHPDWQETVGAKTASRRPALGSGRALMAVADEAWAEAARREAVIRPLCAAPRVGRVAIALAVRDLGLSQSRIYALLQAFHVRPVTASLLPSKSGPVGLGERALSALDRAAGGWAPVLLEAARRAAGVARDRRGRERMFAEPRRRAAECFQEAGRGGRFLVNQGSFSCQ